MPRLIYDSRVRLPDRTLPHHAERDKLGAPKYELDATAGDLIYLLCGFVHEALTSEEESLHITVGMPVRRLRGGADDLQVAGFPISRGAASGLCQGEWGHRGAT